MHTGSHGSRLLYVGVLDLDAGTVRQAGQEVSLTLLELRLLRYLDARGGEQVSVEDIYADVWGNAPQVQTRALDRLASRLRKKIERDTHKPDHLLRVPGEGLAFRPLPAPAPELPQPASRLFGRQAELSRLRALLRAHRRVTILGPGGVGKTLLALEAARLATADFPGGTLFVDMSEAQSEGALAAALGRALDVPTSGDTADLHRALAARGAALVVLDNLEQARDAAATVLVAWGEAAPVVTFLATSRSPLRLPGEQRLPLSGLAAPEAVALFVARAAAVRPGFVAGEDTAALVAQLDGLPLAIEMAAARCALLTPHQIAAQLPQRLALLHSQRHDRPARHRSLRATIAWSWALLSAESRQALVCAALFASPFTPQAAAAVFPPGPTWSLDLLQSLVEESLLRCVEEPGGYRFAMAASVRAFALEQLAESGLDAAGLRGRLARHLAETLGPDIVRDRLRERAAELGNLLVGAAQDADPDSAVACAMAAVDLLRWWGPLEQATALLEATVRRPGLAPEQRAALWIRAATVARTRGDQGAARRALEHALADLNPAAFPALFASARTTQGLIRLQQGETAAAREDLQAAIAAAQRGAAPSEEATARSNLGYLELQGGDQGAAREHYQTALRLFRRLGDRVGEGAVLDKLCNLSWACGELERSRRYGEQALAVHREVGNRTFEAIALGNLGTLHQQAGQPAAARALYTEALALHRQLGNDFGACITAVYLGGLDREEGQPTAAAATLAAALRQARRLDVPSLEARALLELGALALDTGDWLGAEEHLEACGPLLGTGDAQHRGVLCCLLGRLALHSDPPSRARARARACCQEAQAIAAALRLQPAARLSRDLARLSAALEDALPPEHGGPR